jgi:hypothetical protein
MEDVDTGKDDTNDAQNPQRRGRRIEKKEAANDSDWVL